MPDLIAARIQGYAAGVRETLDTLERSGCLTTSHARRFVARLRRQMTTSPASDMVPCPHREALERMHRNLYPEQYEPGATGVYQWHAGTIEDVAAILNDALGRDSEGRDPARRRARPHDLSGRPLDPVDPITGA